MSRPKHSFPVHCLLALILIPCLGISAPAAQIDARAVFVEASAQWCAESPVNTTMQKWREMFSWPDPCVRDALFDEWFARGAEIAKTNDKESGEVKLLTEYAKIITTCGDCSRYSGAEREKAVRALRAGWRTIWQ